MTQVDPTNETLADGAHVEPAAGGAAVDPASFTLAELSSALGKDFKDKESAIKAVKDTFSFVGKRREDIEAEVRAALPAQQDPSLKSELKSLKDDLFYTKNPQYQDHRDLIAKMGGDPAEVVASPEFKGVFDRMKVADEADKAKSIVSSSPRLAQAKTVTDNAMELVKAGASTDQVAESLAAGIAESLKG